MILAVAAAQVMGSRKKSSDYQKASPQVSQVSQAPQVQPSLRTTGLKHVLMCVSLKGLFVYHKGDNYLALFLTAI